MKILGRKKEVTLLNDCLESRRPEFLAVYGRRRVGKTYLIREFFGQKFSFYATGVANKKTRDQRRAFGEWLKKYGDTSEKEPGDWYEAFSRLESILEDERVYREPISGKRVIFLDEVPWMDTARSDFKSALDMFWNGWASARPDVLLIVCGSATSWVINNLILDTGGFYNRVTRQIHLAPFTLAECEELFSLNEIPFQRRQIIESYMVFGGIPYYLNLIDKRLSLAQNIDSLLFDERGALHTEYDMMFRSLFRNSKKHLAIIETMAKRRYGVLRTELAAEEGIGDGEPLTTSLLELEQCGFIRKYKNYTKEKQGFYYQIMDPFILFYLKYVKDGKTGSWLSYKDEGGYYAWRGLAYELVCQNHLVQIKQALGISGVETGAYAWRSEHTKPGVQIDLVIDRKDDVINLCEMKYSDRPYSIDAEYEKHLLYKAEVFRNETHPKKAIHLTMITVDGLEKNAYANSIQNEITGDELFA